MEQIHKFELADSALDMIIESLEYMSYKIDKEEDDQDVREYHTGNLDRLIEQLDNIRTNT